MTPLNLTVDFRSAAPIYTQIVEQIQNLVLSGALKPGDQLPTVRRLATELRVNFNTVARAYRILDDLGLISTQQGRGTYIWQPPGPGDAQAHRRRALEEFTRHYLTDALAMGFSPDEVRAIIEQELGSLAEPPGGEDSRPTPPDTCE